MAERRQHIGCHTLQLTRMPTKPSISGLSAVIRPAPRRTLFQRRTISPQLQPSPSAQTRWLSASAPKCEETEFGRADPPRWRSTPQRMAAPIRSRPKPLDNEFKVNEDPERLDQVYKQLLGKGGENVLSEEVKWLAVTHKSFDHGRRGFNDRLAFMGTSEVFTQRASLGK